MPNPHGCALPCHMMPFAFIGNFALQELAVHNSEMISAQELKRLLLGLGIEPQQLGDFAELDLLSRQSNQLVTSRAESLQYIRTYIYIYYIIIIIIIIIIINNNNNINHNSNNNNNNNNNIYIYIYSL